jgi:hypothetical protein
VPDCTDEPGFKLSSFAGLPVVEHTNDAESQNKWSSASYEIDKAETASMTSAILASQILIGTMSMSNFILTLQETNNGTATKCNIASTFLALSNEGRANLELPPHAISSFDEEMLKSRVQLKMIRLGMIKLGVLPELIDFGTDGFACDASICKVFKVA